MMTFVCVQRYRLPPIAIGVACNGLFAPTCTTPTTTCKTYGTTNVQSCVKVNCTTVQNCKTDDGVKTCKPVQQCSNQCTVTGTAQTCTAWNYGPQVCTQQCDAQNPCPSGFVCNGGYCFAGTAPEAGANQLTSGNSSSGCNIAPDPNQPQPWKGGVAALLVGLALAARRRR